MKTKSVKKLQLSKKAIANFNEEVSSKVKGGGPSLFCGVPHSLLCPSHSICPPGQHCY